MQRRTITVPDDLGEEVDGLVRDGVVPSVSRFFQDAARRHLAELRGEAAGGGGRTAPGPHRTAPRPPWNRLREDPTPR